MELTINDRIRNRKVTFFNEVKISLKYNTLASTFSLSFYYDPNIIEQKEMACIGHYHICYLSHNGELILTGIILSEAFTGHTKKTLVTVSGYSLTGVLEDSSIPTDGAIDAAIEKGNLKIKPGEVTPYAPLQSDGLSLREIAEKLLAPFKLTMVIDGSVSDRMEEKFSESNAKPRDSVKHYLTELATQKDINLSHNEKGQVVFTKAKTNLKPILDFNIPVGGLPGTKMDLHFNGQAMHSQITVVKQAEEDGDNAGEFTVDNPFVYTIFRPKTVVQSSGNELDTELAAKKARADELRHLPLTITIDRWDINNKLIKPGNIISVINQEIYIFKKTNFFIESVDYEGDQTSLTAVLHCVLPSVYDGSEPVYIFSGINIH